MLVRSVILYSFVYNILMNDDNLVTALSAQIQVSRVLIGMVRKPLVGPIVLAK